MKQRVTRALAGFIILIGMSSAGFAAPSNLIGYWATGKNQAVTQIYGCGDGLLCGELVGFPMKCRGHGTISLNATSSLSATCVLTETPGEERSSTREAAITTAWIFGYQRQICSGCAAMCCCKCLAPPVSGPGTTVRRRPPIVAWQQIL